MSKEVELKVMACPNCGASLKAKNAKEAITCVYCGNTIVPVTETSTTTDNSSFLRVEGIKTSSSALAYLELFFEEYDWDAFSYAQTLSIAEIDELADSLKASAADDKNTWIVCFKAMYVPFIHKITGCEQLLSSVIEEYKKDNLDAYSKYDAYKRISTMILAYQNNTIASLEKIISYASKYGASSDEINSLYSDIEHLKAISTLHIYQDIESIPEIIAFINEKNVKIANSLAEKGINAEKEYQKANALIEEEKYVDALNTLISLEGYSDSNQLIKKINKYFLISDVCEIEGKLYFFKKENQESDILCLYPTTEGKIATKPIITNIAKIVKLHADTIYYMDDDYYLQKYSFSTNTKTKAYDKALADKSFYSYNNHIYMLAQKKESTNDNKEFVSLNLINETTQTILESVTKILSFTGNKVIYQISEKTDPDSYEENYKTYTNIINVDSLAITNLGTKNISIEGFIDNYVVYTQESPNEYNHNLYLKALDSDEPEKLIEQNIFEFYDIIANKLFYYIGNSRNKSLININCDGSERKEWPLYISKILFEQGDWLYFIRSAGYNSILCKSRLDGSKFSIIASDIDEFIDIKNGYLYYIDDASTLVKIRMDGSNKQKLCQDVETVLSVKENKIIFVSIDDRITKTDSETSSTKIVKSIYAVDFSGSGKIKLAYNIKCAKEYDDNTVYYIAAQEIKSSYEQLEKLLDVLYKLNVETNQVEKLLELQEQEEEKSMAFIIAMVIMGILFFVTFVAFAGGVPGLGVISLLAAITTLGIGIYLKTKKNE